MIGRVQAVSITKKISYRLFSSSIPSHASKVKVFKRLRSQEIKKTNLAKQASLREKLHQVDPVLGKPNNMFIDRMRAEVEEGDILSHGYETEDVNKLLYGAQQAILAKSEDFNQAEVIKAEERKREIVSRILSIRNGARGDQLKLSKKLAIKEFQRFEGDTGSSEAQAASMSMKIQFLVDHVKKNPKDFSTIRKLRILVQQRQSILRYLKRDNPERYYWAITKLGLSDHSVAMEFNLDKQYMQDHKMFGDKVLVKLSKKVIGAKRREARKQKKANRAQPDA